MKRLSRLILATLGLVLAIPVNAQAADPSVGANLVDGMVSVSDSVCSWTNGSTSDNPPNTLTIYRNTINPPGGNLTCTSGYGLTLSNDPVVTFNSDSSMTIDRIEAALLGGICSYSANWVRLYNGSGSFTAYLKWGSSPYCPSTVSGSLTLTFH